MEKLDKIGKPLLEWFYQNKRILPWRENTHAYRVWVSEIMLQQTRVEAVKPYFERFMDALPTIRDLAEVDEEKLLKLWEGLGYYNRARNLQKAAIKVMDEYDGSLPADYAKLLKLPGIGSYTAGAIASISFRLCEPAVDGNVLRVLSRLTMNNEDILSQKVKRFWEDRIRAVIPKETPGDFNQALMELGATICVPNGAPHCEECPLKAQCMAHKQNREMDFPYKKSQKARRIEYKTILIIKDGDKVILQKRQEKGLLSGMYEFPSMEGNCREEEVIRYLESMGYRVIRLLELKKAKHIFSHVEWHMTGYAVRVEETGFAETECEKSKTEETKHGKRSIATKTEHISVHPDETKEAYPIPSAFRAYIGYADIDLGTHKEAVKGEIINNSNSKL